MVGGRIVSLLRGMGHESCCWILDIFGYQHSDFRPLKGGGGKASRLEPVSYVKQGWDCWRCDEPWASWETARSRNKRVAMAMRGNGNARLKNGDGRGKKCMSLWRRLWTTDMDMVALWAVCTGCTEQPQPCWTSLEDDARRFCLPHRPPPGPLVHGPRST